MKKIILITIISAFSLSSIAGNGKNITVDSEENSIHKLLQAIETNNKELQAGIQSAKANKIEIKTSNNLADPTFSYTHQWAEQSHEGTTGELVISQEFDFPTLYTQRSKLNKLAIASVDNETLLLRRNILLKAKELCLDIIMLYQQKEILDEQLNNAMQLKEAYSKRLKIGDANKIESNKLALEYLNAKTAASLNETTLKNKIQELTALNGNRPLDCNLHTYPAVILPANYKQFEMETLSKDYALQRLSSESAVSQKRIELSKSQWLPKLELGYRRNTQPGQAFNGVILGFSVPLFSNKGKVKVSKAEALSIELQKDDEEKRAMSILSQLYHEAQSLSSSMNEYKKIFENEASLSLLKDALTGGEISIIEYFTEVTVIYQSKLNYVQLENRYQKVIANLYKNEL